MSCGSEAGGGSVARLGRAGYKMSEAEEGGRRPAADCQVVARNWMSILKIVGSLGHPKRETG